MRWRPAARDRELCIEENALGLGQRVPVRIDVTADEVLVYARDTLVGRLNRPLFQGWLAHHEAPLDVDDVSFTIDRRLPRERIAISVPDVYVWPLSPAAQHELWSLL